MIKMVQSLEGYFAERLQELIIIEMPRVALTLKDAIWPLVPEKTKSKVKFMTVEQAKEYVQAKCDPEVSRRLLAIMEQNRDPGISLEERKRSWMRVNECGELIPAFAQARDPAALRLPVLQSIRHTAARGSELEVYR